MQIKNKHILTMLVMAGISVAALPASAATFAQGDLLLAFNQTSGSGANTVLTIDLGNASQFVNAHNTSTNLTNIANLGSILSSTYGSNMLTSSDANVYWTVAGSNTSGGTLANGDTAKTTYLTLAQDGIGAINGSAQVTSNFNSGLSVRNGYANQIGADQTAYTNTAGTSPVAVPIGNTGWVTDAQGGWGNGSLTVQGSFANGVSGTALDLYRIVGSTGSTQTPSVYLGTFTLDSSGNLSFNTTVSAAPEPSRAVFAALGLGTLLLRRRRRVNA